MPLRLEALPVGLVVLVVLFGAYVWGKKREIARLRGGFEVEPPPSPIRADDDGLKHLLSVVTHSQQGFRSLIDSLDHVVFHISLEGTIRVVNRRFIELVKKSFPEVVNHRLGEFFLEPSREEALRALPNLLECGFWAGVVRVQLRESTVPRYFDCVLHTVETGREVTGIAGLARDITSQRETESRFTELFETLQEGVYFSTPEGKLLDANPALVKMLGYASKEDLLKVNARDLYFDLGERAQFLAALEQQGVVRNHGVTLQRKDGRPVQCLDSSTAIRDATGRVFRFQGTLVDITERVAIEKRLHQEQELVRRLIASFPDIIVVLDTEGRYSYVNARIQDLLGYTPDEFLGHNLAERPHPQDRPAVLEFFQGLIAGKTNFGALEYRTRHKDGSWRTFRANACPLLDAEGKITGVVASARDITESKQLEQQLLQTEKLAAMGQMIAGVAHELNNPLTAILGVADLLRERSVDDAMRRQTELVYQQARRAADIVQDLLSFSRPSAPTRSRIRFEELVKNALRLEDSSLRKSQIAVEVVAEENLPELEGNPHQLIQVLLNLLINAEQAISSVRDHGRIRVTLGKSAGWFVCSVGDDGPGMRPEVLARIFDPFFTTKRPGGGTGLGLTISLAIAKEHGGRIDAESLPNGGALFHLLLPIASQTAEILPLRASGLEASSLRGRSLLVVDDEKSIRELVHDGLSARGMAVDCASSAEEALERLSACSPDFILCDFHLPGLGGGEFFERIRACSHASTPRFVFMTGDLIDAATIASLESRGARALRKPFQISRLAAVLEDVLASIEIKTL